MDGSDKCVAISVSVITVAVMTPLLAATFVNCGTPERLCIRGASEGLSVEPKSRATVACLEALRGSRKP